jgi:hypothetical protein
MSTILSITPRTATLQPLPEPAELAPSRAVFPSGQTVGERPDDRTARILYRFEPTSLAALFGISLLNRVDTKYLISASELPSILLALAPAYRVLDIDGCREHRYQTTYFDTPDLALYYEHHAGRAVRHKVRSRSYVDSGRTFFEIKAKTNSGRTVKHRLETGRPLAALTPAVRAFLAEYLPRERQVLQPVLHNTFRRITLAGIQSAERLTLDLNVQFERADSADDATAIGHAGPDDGPAMRGAGLPGVVVAELKQSGVDRRSPFVQLMQRQHLRPTSVSKYCVGVAMLRPEVRHNRFKIKLRAIEKLARREADVR